MEVTTLNISADDKGAFKNEEVAELNQERTVQRFLGKIRSKRGQLKYGYDRETPSVLVVFDYSAFSGLGSQTSNVFDSLIGKTAGVEFSLPRELSAVAYIHRSVGGGLLAINKSNSIVYHNPICEYPIDADIFQEFVQLRGGFVEEPPAPDDVWIVLGNRI